MTDPAVLLVLTIQTTLVFAGLLILPWGGVRLDEATHSARNLRRRLRALAARVTRDGEPPATRRVLPGPAIQVRAV